jgi:CBS domain containing-hemolysin-like protein
VTYPADLLFHVPSLLLLLIASAFFSGSETALFSLQESDLEEMARSSSRRAQLAVTLARRSNRTLVTLLLANLLVNVLLSVLITGMCLRWFGPAGLGVAIPAASVLLILFGEIFPKTLGLRQGRGAAERVAPIVEGVARLLGPVRRALEGLAERVAGPRVVRPLDKEELATLVDVTQQEGGISPFEAEVLLNILTFAKVTVDRCMTPRVDMVALEADASYEEVVATYEASGRSRIVVIEGDRDHVVGVLLLKDFLTHDPAQGPRTVRALMRPAVFVPESLSASRLFHQLMRDRVHLAIVVGEHGGVEGVVTLEDLLEEIVGDIRDERDVPQDEIEMMPDGSWRAEAGIDLDDLGDAMGVELGEGRDAVTLSGLLEEELGRVPRAGDHVTLGPLDFRVLTALPTRPLWVQVNRRAEGS